MKNTTLIVGGALLGWVGYVAWKKKKASDEATKRATIAATIAASADFFARETSATVK